MKISVSRFFAVLFSAAALVIFCAANVRAQRSALDAYAITNARIVTVSGETIERGTIVVRDGLIAAVGANVTAPADARVIDGAGLTVYPGFFDASTNIGIAGAQTGGGRPQPGQQPQQNQPQSNSAFPAGLQPETSAADLFRPSDSAFESARNNGFTTALVVPRERIFVGQSALVNLSGETAAQSIVRAPVALHIAFVTLQTGQFPTALMGTFAAIRQMFLDAQRLDTMQKAYAKNPRGMRRPEENKSLEALIPVLNNSLPVVFQADTEREIIRALDLAREFNFKAMIAGGAESYRVADRLRAQNVPVLLSLNFPKRATTSPPEADPESLETLRYRAAAPKTAAKLAQARVPFAFQSGGMANLSEFWTNAGKAVENGLSKADALRAMTANSANIFGVANQLGTIEPGKIANLTVVRGDVFDKNCQFTHVFVDGRMFEIKNAPPAAANKPATGATVAPANVPNLAGTWNLTVEVPGQTTQATLNLTQQGDKLSGSLQAAEFGTSELKSGEVTADGFTFTVVITAGQTFDVVFSGKINGSQMTGTATTPQGAAPFSGTKTP